MTDPPSLVCRGRSLDTSSPLVMGVVNATPDSFSDRTRLTTVEARVGASLQLLDDGADILDVGGQSGITSVPEISEDEEIERVIPLLDAIVAARPDAVISVDTYRPRVARAAIEAGASLINDVSGLQHPEIVELCARAECALVLMHTRVAPKKKLLDPALYDDVTADVVDMLTDRWRQAGRLGLGDEAGHLPDVLGRRRLVARAAVAHHIGAQGAMGHAAAHVHRVGFSAKRFKVFGK